MGVTTLSIKTIQDVVDMYQTKSVCDLGAQNDYRDEVIRSGRKPVPYISEWYKARGIDYKSIDLSGENGSEMIDLSQVIGQSFGQFDLVGDFGTSEHVMDYYTCNLNIHNLCKKGGIMIREVPLKGNWPAHGIHYVDEEFFIALAYANDYEVLDLLKRAAMGNTTDGWNVVAVMRKTKDNVFCLHDEFPSFQSFDDYMDVRSQNPRLWRR